MINQVTLVGRLTRNPELKVTTEGTPVTNVTLAVSRHYRNQNGEVDADFVQCTLWRRAAENTAAYCRKGSVLGITGRIQTRHYDNHEGKRVYITEVVAENVSFLSNKPHAEPASQARGNQSTSAGSLSGTGSRQASSGSASEVRSNPPYSGSTSGTGSNPPFSGSEPDSRSSGSFAAPASGGQDSHSAAGSNLPAPANSREGLPLGM